MKQFTKYGLFSMALLAGMAAFTACSSDDNLAEETAPVNPSYDGKTVKTQFAINIPRAATAGKRMTASDTQNDATPSFLGMGSIYLMPMDIGSSSSIGGTSAITEIIGLSDIGSSEVSSTDGQKIYSDVTIPVGTDHFLFYGQAPDATVGSDIENNFARGVLESNIGGSTAITTAGGIEFNLKQISTAISNQDLLDQLNAVAKASGWKDLTGDTGDEGTLKDLYAAFTSLKAGSANAIKATLQNLYNAVAPLSTSGTQTTIAQAILKAITTGTDGLFDAAENSGTGTYTLSWKSGTEDAVQNFPTSTGLPEGAVQLKFESDAFTYLASGIQIGGTPHVDVASITYPARLAYYVGTPLKASTSNSPTWDWTNGTWTGWTAEVDATTRAIALENKINYGVAALETKVKFASSSLTDKQDGHYITINAQDFTLTGVLVGSQPDKVMYNMEPATSSPSLTQTVWDRAVNANTYVTTNDMATPNYTLLLDNGNIVGKAVNFALELQNNSKSTIYGVDGIVQPDMKFYLVGTLNPDAGAGVTNPDPSVTDAHVFMKDYLTKANVTISSFENAYVTIPDLRSTQLQLGLYVDLTWQKGYTFNVEIGE